MLSLLAPAGAGAAANPEELLTYEPAGFTNSVRPGSEVDGLLANLDSYGIGQALLQLPGLKKNGHLKLNKKQAAMVPLWAERASLYNAAHGTHIAVIAVLNGQIKKKKLNLEEASTRREVVAAAESLVAKGVAGVHLDFEPYPQSPGFILLLEELDAAFARLGFTGRLSVVAPANVSRWPPSYLAQVSSHVAQLDPLFYDSEITTTAAYEKWVEEGLAYYSANAAPGARIVPVIPSYGASRFHDPAVENIANATAAIEAALAAGSRVDGAGIWWWWGFFYDEEGEGEYDASADRAAWLSTTLNAPFTP